MGLVSVLLTTAVWESNEVFTVKMLLNVLKYFKMYILLLINSTSGNLSWKNNPLD